MEYINLLFATKESHNQWLENESDLKQTREDLNVSEIVRFLKTLDQDFFSQYLFKPCLREEDANYRLDIMYELYTNEALLNRISEYNKLLINLYKSICDWSKEESKI